MTTRQQRNAEQKKRAGSKGRGKELSATGYKLESVVAINLVQRGYVLFKPEFDAMQGDFVAIEKKRLLIEVKKGIERKDRTNIGFGEVARKLDWLWKMATTIIALW